MNDDLAGLVGALVTAGAPGSAAVRANPYPLLARLQAESPVYRAPDGRWIVTSYDLCQRLLRDGGWHREPDTPEDQMSLAVRVFMRSVVFRDPPAHTRLRHSLSSLFTPKAVTNYRDVVERRVRQVLTDARLEPEFDFRNGPSYQLPVLVIGDLLGIPSQDVFEFDEWSATLLHLDEHDHAGESLTRANAAARQALDYFTDLIAFRRDHPGDDIVSALLAEEERCELSIEEIAGLCILLHIGGHSTTNDVIANALPHLLARPGTIEQFAADPILVDSAVEEMLRFDPVIQASLPRIASADHQLGGQTIRKGEAVQAVLAAANRDPDVFVDAETFDVRRDPNRHLSFAAGAHFCLGAHLGRLEVRSFYTELARECPALEMTVAADDLVYMDSFLHRGITSLPVRWRDQPLKP